MAIAAVLFSPVSSIAEDLTCSYDIVESMPDKLAFNSTLKFKPKPTHEALLEMIDGAKNTLRVASFYWTLSAEPEFASHPSARPGKLIMDSLVAAVRRGVDLEVVLDRSSRKSMSNEDDVKVLEKIGTVRYLNMSRLLKSGIMHSKILIADNETFYLGSSNFDWRSYTQIKEIGIKVAQCPQLAQDLDKVFQTYMYIAMLNEIPIELPEYLKTEINIDHPIELTFGKALARIFLGSAPPAFNGLKDWTGRTDDIDGLLHIVDKAKHRIDISVMNYSPRTAFIWPKKFWPKIDDALRRAASERRVRVRLLFSDWSHTSDEELMWYRSLNAVQSPRLNGGGISVRLMKVPAFDTFQKNIPYARVKHDKYLVTDNGLFIGTSNWSPDYFISTCGVSLVVTPETNSPNSTITSHHPIIDQMSALFTRDFESIYSRPIDMSPRGLKPSDL